MVRLIVEIAHTSYPVLIGNNVTRDLRAVTKRMNPTAVAVVADRNARRLAKKAMRSLKSFRTSVHFLEAGERTKSMDALGDVLGFLERSRMDRSGVVIAVGGGSIGDLAGLAASVWQRGVRWIGVPTTLLAMVDSSVGGKTGINGTRSKNAIGTFWQPSAVIADLEALDTLPDIRVREAFAEVVKYGVAMDHGLFELLRKDRDDILDGDPAALEQVIARCVTDKALVVARDERDLGPRAILNYGHTVAHAVEIASHYRVSHGRAVAFGMRMAAQISLAIGLCGKRLVQAQDELLTAYGLPDRPPAVDPERVLEAIPRDKKARAGHVAWVLPRFLGHAEVGHAVPPAVVRRVIRKALA